MTIFLLNSCRKDSQDNISPKKTGNNTSVQDKTDFNNESSYNTNNDEIRIKNLFNALAVNDNQEIINYQPINLVLDLESILNYKYGNINNPKVDPIEFNKSFSIELKNGGNSISHNKASLLLNMIKNELESKINTFENSSTQWILRGIDLKIESSTSLNMIVSANYYFNVGENLDLAAVNEQFNNDYFWGLQKGKCNYTDIPNDAAKMITKLTNRNMTKALPAFPSGYRIYAKNIDGLALFPKNWVLDGSTFPSTNPGGFQSSVIFAYYGLVNNSDVCIPKSQLNTYLSNYQNIIFPMAHSKSFYSLNVLTGVDLCNYEHWYMSRYCTYVKTLDPISL